MMAYGDIDHYQTMVLNIVTLNAPAIVMARTHVRMDRRTGVTHNVPAIVMAGAL